MSPNPQTNQQPNQQQGQSGMRPQNPDPTKQTFGQQKPGANLQNKGNDPAKQSARPEEEEDEEAGSAGKDKMKDGDSCSTSKKPTDY